jgi:hypothetical protein
MEKVEIKTNPMGPLGCISALSVFSLIILYYLTQGSNKYQHALLAVVLILSILGIIYLLNELRGDKSKMVLSVEGIELLGKGFYKWIDVESYEFVERNNGENTSNYLILKLKNATQVEVSIDTLDKHKSEIKSLLETYQAR